MFIPNSMDLNDLVNRSPVPVPWEEGDNIPWSDPEFSRKMLREHLRQDHNAASRRFEIIDRHVAWIHNELLQARPAKILDLGCGPGLYSNRLAKLGHDCTGIDFSPASIEYAVSQAEQDGLGCEYIQDDIRVAEYGIGYGLVMLIFGELNVFRPEDAKRILTKANDALADGGLLLLEPHTFEYVRGIGERPSSWYSSQGGLFSDEPHIRLGESFWALDTSTTTRRDFVIHVSTGNVTRYAQSLQAYTDAQYQSLLSECGFEEVTFFPSLTGSEQDLHEGLFAIAARKPEA